MKWWPDTLRRGDMIRVRVGDIWHYGIYVSNDQVIQFGLPPREGFPPPEEVRVCACDIDTFAGDDIVETARWTLGERLKNHSPQKTIALARARLGEGGYNLLHNNCEHFAYECATGVKYCEQEESVRRQWRERPLLKVYFQPLPAGDDMPPLPPPERMAEVQQVSHPLLRRQKYWAWKTLEKAAKLNFGLSLQDLQLKKQKNGKWVSPQLFFSITHAGEWVAVAISTRAVGIDMEPLDTARDPAWLSVKEKAIVKIASEKEKKQFDLNKPEHLLALWTRKECAFKHSDAAHFKPAAVDAAAEDIRTLLTENGFVFSVCSQQLGSLQLFTFEQDRGTKFTAKEWDL